MTEQIAVLKEAPDRAYCPACQEVRLKPELIFVPRDLGRGLDEFIGCRVCNAKTETEVTANV